MRFDKLILLAALLVLPTAASADPCTGAPPFTDVNAGALYCTNTEWLANRNVTTGCTSTTYCPDDAVSRAQMALFMNRLGVALTPSIVMTEDGFDPVNLDAETFHCISPTYTIAEFPRTLVLTAHFSGLTDGAANYNVAIRYNTTGSTTSFPNTVQDNPARTGTSAVAWTHASASGSLPVDVGSTYRFAITVVRESGTANLTDTRCHLLQQLQNRNGATSPFDAKAMTAR